MNGNNKTISNYKLEQKYNESQYDSNYYSNNFGFFGILDDAYIENINFKDSYIKFEFARDEILDIQNTGIVAGYVHNSKLENINCSGTVISGYKVG